jgi:hypothetical protein
MCFCSPGVVGCRTDVDDDEQCRMLNGLGGSADFLGNAKLSIMHTPSVYVRPHFTQTFYSVECKGEVILTELGYRRPTKSDPARISCIVPFALYIDQTGAWFFILLVICSLSNPLFGFFLFATLHTFLAATWTPHPSTYPSIPTSIHPDLSVYSSVKQQSTIWV